MDRYKRVEKPKAESEIAENEIRITSQGRTRNYITYAMSLLQEKGSDDIVFKAMGRAITKTVTIVELIKRRIVDLHQNNSIGSIDITDTWEPLEEGLLPLETTRHVSMITITLSKKELDTSSIGYQPPLPADQVKSSTELDYEDGSPNYSRIGRGGRGGGGRGRGRSRGNVNTNHDDGGLDDKGCHRGLARGRGQGRCRGFQGPSRGGYNGPETDAHQGFNHQEDDDCVINAIVVLKKSDVRRYEECEECVILDFDPFETVEEDLGQLIAAREIDEDVVVISEKGQVACRDYPHSRHLCVKFPFDNTLHEHYCELCYCYVCDTSAPCKYWNLLVNGHCHASDRIQDWKIKRETARMGRMHLE